MGKGKRVISNTRGRKEKGDCMGDLPLELASATGLSPEGAHSFRSAFDSFRSKGEEWWAKAELRAADLITSIQPNPASESRRQAVVDYVTKLIQSCVNCQVRLNSAPIVFVNTDNCVLLFLFLFF